MILNYQFGKKKGKKLEWVTKRKMERNIKGNHVKWRWREQAAWADEHVT